MTLIKIVATALSPSGLASPIGMSTLLQGGNIPQTPFPDVNPATAAQTGRAEKQRRGHQSSGRLDHLTELQLWQRALTHINVARRKSGECFTLGPVSASEEDLSCIR